MLGLRRANLGGKNKWRWLLLLLMMAMLMLGHGWMLKHKLMKAREVGLIWVTVLTATAFVEYYRRRYFTLFKRRAEQRLNKQAKRFHAELWKVIHFKPLGNDELDMLMNLQKEFRQIHPADKYDTTDLKGVLRKESETGDLTGNTNSPVYQ